MRRVLKDESPFSEVPSGIEIAHYFVDQTDRRNPGCDGIDLYRKDRDYCYLWVEGMFDHDMWLSYLLDIRTAVGREDKKFRESRDFLFVHFGTGGIFEVEWHNHPIDFDATVEEHRERSWTGWQWFLKLMEAALEREWERRS